MISQGALEEAVLALLCFSPEQASLLALKITEPRFFSNRTNQLIAQTALDYIKKYSSPPKAQIDYLLENDYLRGEEGKLLRLTVEDLGKRVAGVDAAFVQEQLDNFLQKQKLTTNLQRALEFLQEGELQRAQEEIYKVSTVPSTGSKGLWMKDARQALNFFNKEEHNDFFSSAIPFLDQLKVVPDRKTLTLLIAASGKGKSWWLVNVGKGGLQYHHKVLHITLEMDQDKTAKRYIQSIFSLTSDETASITISTFDKDALGNTVIGFRELERESIIQNKLKIKQKIEDWFSCPPWIIKEFPTSSLSIEHLYLYLDSLEKEYGFRPDLIIIDYADLMKINAADLRVDTGRLYRDLRGLAMSRNAALVTATQGNRESETAKLVGSTNVSEDWSKIGTADNVFTYSQTPAEHKLGRARFFVPKARDSQFDRFLLLISQAYRFGQFCMDSTLMTVQLANSLQEQNP